MALVSDLRAYPEGIGTMIRKARGALARLAVIVGLFSMAMLLIAATRGADVIADAWGVDGSPRHADAIVVLGGGTTWPGELLCASVHRLEHAVWLYQRGYAPRLVFSGAGDTGYPDLPAEGEMLRRRAVAMGIPSDRIVTEPFATRTYENGTRVAAIMRTNGWQTAVLVTDAIHMHRARLVFERLGITVYPSASFSERSLSALRGLILLEYVTYEVIGTMFYRVRGWL